MGHRAEQIPQTMRLQDHLSELRKRLFICLSVLILSSFVVYLFYEPILNILRSPLGMTLYYSTPAASIELVVKICLMGALVITMPVITYNLIMFIQPAFNSLSQRKVLTTTSFSAILAVLGALFGYFCILPGTLTFLGGFEVDGLSALISANEYLSFVTNIIILFAAIFQLPLLMDFFDTIKPQPIRKLLAGEKWVILISLIIALLAPFTYDLLTSLLIAAPMIVLYNLSIIIIAIRRFSSRNKTDPLVIAKPTNMSSIDNMFVNPAMFTEDLEKIPTIEKAPQTHISYIDMKPSKQHQEPVQPAAWVKERELKRRSINTNVKVWSDIRRATV